jgi:aspartate beta-hydroxylase
MTSELPSGAVRLREMALNSLQQGDAVQAEQRFLQLLELLPGNFEALQFLASRHMVRGDAIGAISLLLVAQRYAPGNATILHQLGTAQMAAGDFTGAARSLQESVAVMPAMFLARLRLGMALERLQQKDRALIAYFGAVNTAQAQGLWLSDASTPPGLRDVVKQSIRFIEAGRHRLFDQILEPLRARYGRSELSRVEECLAIYLGEKQAVLPDSRQKPKFLYFPGIPSQTYYGSERFPWQAALEAATEAIKKEMKDVLAEGLSLQPFLQADSPELLDAYLKASTDRPPAWDAYFFYRHGERYDDHCDRCSQTTGVLESLPLVRVRDHAPETLYSVLRPGTHILPHRGVTNTRLVTHLPLMVPENCALRVGGETHVWQEGRCITFDDTFEHEAWNKSAETRVVLIVDSWNPDLTEAERAAVTELVGAIGDFNRACEMPVQS